jgi:hypothetical protein
VPKNASRFAAVFSSLRRACEKLAGTPVDDAEVHGHEGVRFAFPMEDTLSDLRRHTL